MDEEELEQRVEVRVNRDVVTDVGVLVPPPTAMLGELSTVLVDTVDSDTVDVTLCDRVGDADEVPVTSGDALGVEDDESV